jgi:sec-independent protein translocase protein TatA
MTLPSAHLAILGLPGGWEWILLLALGLLLFGRRLPEVGRSLGRSIVEFKKGVKGIEDEINSASDEPAPAKPLPESDPRAVSRAETPEPTKAEPAPRPDASASGPATGHVNP